MSHCYCKSMIGCGCFQVMWNFDTGFVILGGKLYIGVTDKSINVSLFIGLILRGW